MGQGESVRGVTAGAGSWEAAAMGTPPPSDAFTEPHLETSALLVALSAAQVARGVAQAAAAARGGRPS